MLAVTAMLHLSRAFDWHHAMLAIVLIFPLVRWRKDFVARSDASSLRVRGARGGAGLGRGAAWTYGTIWACISSAQKGNFGQPLTVEESLRQPRLASAVFSCSRRITILGRQRGNVRRFLEQPCAWRAHSWADCHHRHRPAACVRCRNAGLPGGHRGRACPREGHHRETWARPDGLLRPAVGQALLFQRGWRRRGVLLPVAKIRRRPGRTPICPGRVAQSR